MKLVKMGLRHGARRVLEIFVPALALLSIFHVSVYIIELST